ncbi:MAG: sugar-binding protein [Verrucomicrobiota bacterium]
MDKNFAAALPARADDPLLIGYFLVNEPLYEDIAKVVPGLKGTWACKRALVAQLSAKYRTIDAFNAAWGLSAASFDALNDAPLAVNTKAAYDDLHTFTGTFFETYFNLVETTFHKYDTHHLLIGNRLQPGTINNQQLCEIAGRHLDIMSFNYYTNQIDRDFLDRLERWTGRPMILSEFFWAAPRESGLVGGREVATQQARGLAYRNYVEQAAATGYVVGVEWFTLIDQASTGRWFSGYSGERSNTGLFAVSDRPYRPMLAEMARANADVYDVWLGGKAPYVFDDPSFAQTGNAKQATTAPHATGPIAVDGTTRNWPGIPPNTISGKRLVLGSEAGGVEGTFKVCWDETNLYILATVIDPTPMMSKVPVSGLWSGDALEIFTGTEKLDDGGPLLFTDRHLTVGVPGPGKAPFHYDNTPGTPDCQALVVPGSDGKSYTVEVAMPWSAIGVQPQAGTELLFDLGIDDSASGTGRRAQLMWSGTDKNSGDRTHWGRLKLLQ